jgi:hypothetical protein
MAALRSLEDERDEMVRDLDRELRDHERLTFNVARMEREGADPDYIDRVREQRDTSRRWIDRIRRNLGLEAAA